MVYIVAMMVRSLHDLCDEFQRSHMRGRPQIPISEDELVYLLELHFTTQEIAFLLGVSPWTIRRRMIQFGLEDQVNFTNIEDTPLNAIVQQFVDTHPNSGQRSLIGFLRSTNLRVQRYRVKESLMTIDPRGVQTGFRRVLHRRHYYVAMPNSLWHIDGYHRLIRWRIVVHGGIDGYSRLPVYLRASSNNRASTVLDSFLGAVQQYGLPSIVRCDRGGENVGVSEFMLTHPDRGPGHRNCITGRSVRNHRIERLWRDVYIFRLHFVYYLFYQLEDDEFLNSENNNDLFALHFVFIPRINHQLELFRDFFSHHPLHSARNQSPLQLWVRGMVRLSSDEAALHGALETH